MFGSNKIRLDPQLYKRAVERAKALGLPSAEAYVASLLEKDLKAADEEALREKVMRKMKGLGYME